MAHSPTLHAPQELVPLLLPACCSLTHQLPSTQLLLVEMGQVLGRVCWSCREMGWAGPPFSSPLSLPALDLFFFFLCPPTSTPACLPKTDSSPWLFLAVAAGTAMEGVAYPGLWRS